ncbi:hypothetical protein Tco_0344931 [Tanacetum coccineum]
MSETEPILPPRPSPALRFPYNQEGEYDLWSMKMRQYIVITDHILWDIITNGNQTTTDPASPSVSAPKTSLLLQRKRNNGKPLTYSLLCQYLDRIFSEELDSAYERFQHILSMLELHDATVSIEDANLKFLRSLPSVWHVVATMIRGQPGLDELDFDDLYNN